MNFDIQVPGSPLAQGAAQPPTLAAAQVHAQYGGTMGAPVVFTPGVDPNANRGNQPTSPQVTYENLPDYYELVRSLAVSSPRPPQPVSNHAETIDQQPLEVDAILPVETPQLAVTYKLVEASSPGRLAYLVNELKSQGWSLSGSLCVSGSGGEVIFYREMEREQAG